MKQEELQEGPDSLFDNNLLSQKLAHIPTRTTSIPYKGSALMTFHLIQPLIASAPPNIITGRSMFPTLKLVGDRFKPYPNHCIMHNTITSDNNNIYRKKVECFLHGNEI
jgi:hypothetical protein